LANSETRESSGKIALASQAPQTPPIALAKKARS